MDNPCVFFQKQCTEATAKDQTTAKFGAKVSTLALTKLIRTLFSELREIGDFFGVEMIGSVIGSNGFCSPKFSGSAQVQLCTLYIVGWPSAPCDNSKLFGQQSEG